MPKVVRLDDHRFPYERRLEQLLAAYKEAQQRIARQIGAAALSGDLERMSERRRQYEEIVRAIDRLGFNTDQDAREIVRLALFESAERTAEIIVSAAPDMPVNGSFGGVSQEAVRTLQDEMLGRLEDARRTIGRRVEDVFAKVGRRQVMLGLLGTDGSHRKVSARIVASLEQQGAKAFVDRAGRQWTLENYADMATRTVTRTAVVEGAKIRMAAQGVDIGRISRHANPCPICAPWQDRLVSIGGQATESLGRPVATFDAMPNGGPPFHPRCKHLVIPDVASIEALRRELGGVA